MPTPEQPNPSSTRPAAELVDGMQLIQHVESRSAADVPNNPSSDAPEPASTARRERDASPEPQFRTIAVRVDEQLHAQLSFIAQLAGNSISDEVRTAIEGRIASAQDDPALIARAQRVREQIEREATARSAAIAGFMGQKAVTATLSDPESEQTRVSATSAQSRPGATASSGSRTRGRRSQTKDEPR